MNMLETVWTLQLQKRIKPRSGGGLVNDVFVYRFMHMAIMVAGAGAGAGPQRTRMRLTNTCRDLLVITTYTRLRTMSGVPPWSL